MNPLRTAQEADPAPDSLDSVGSSDGRYRGNATISLPVGHGSHLVYSTVNRSAQIFPSHLVKFLDHCDSFKRLEEHAEVFYREIDSARDQTELLISRLSGAGLPSYMVKLLELLRSYLRNQASHRTLKKTEIESSKEDLRRLVETGFLVSEEALARRCRQRIADETFPPPIATVGVVTRDRVDILKRCLISYIENTKKYGRSNDFVVMDDSGSIHTRNQTRELLQDLSGRYGVDIRYAGLEEKTRFAKALLAEGLPEEVVKFALFDVEECGHTMGANRNALLLHTVGDMVFTADDDTVCSVGSTPDATDGLALNSSFGFLEWDFFPDRQSALQSIVPVDEDLLAGHELLLGRNVGSCISSFSKSSGLTFGGMSNRLVQTLQRGEGRILVTFPGVIGDSGMHSPQGYFMVGANSHQRLTKSRRVYRSACKSRETLHSVNCWTVTDLPWCMATAMGYDNRKLLPPFMPVKRNEDGLFGIVLRVCYGEALLGHVPRAIHHLPGETRFYQPRDMWECASRYRLCNTIAACIRSFEPPPGFVGKEQALQALGKHLTELGSMSQPDFEEYVRIQGWQMEAIYIRLIQDQLREYGESPRFWAKDIHKLLGELRIALRTREYFVPQDLLDCRDLDAARELARRLTFKFGQLLYWWPEILKAAKILRARDNRLASCVAAMDRDLVRSSSLGQRRRINQPF